jgi:hypothetical protein
MPSLPSASSSSQNSSSAHHIATASGVYPHGSSPASAVRQSERPTPWRVVRGYLAAIAKPTLAREYPAQASAMPYWPFIIWSKATNR